MAKSSHTFFKFWLFGLMCFISLTHCSLKAQSNNSHEILDLIRVADSLETKNVALSKQSALKALNLALEDHNDTLAYQGRFFLAISHFNMANHNQALELFIENLALAKKIGKKGRIIKALNAIANTYKNMARYQQAIDTYKEALALCAEPKYKSFSMLLKSNMIGIYRELKSNDTSIAYCYDIIDIINTHGSKDTVFVSNIYGELLFNYFALNKTDSVNKYLDKTINLKRRSGDIIGLASFLHNIGSYYADLGDDKKAEKYYKESLVLQHDNPEVIYNSKQQLAKLLFEQKRFEESAQLYSDCLVLKDSIASIQTVEKLSELEVKYETGKKEEELKRLAITSEMDALKLKHSKMWLLVSIAGAFFCLLGAVVLFRQFKSKQSANKLLETQNHEILEQKKEITDSINYAKRIQTAILPPKRYVDSLLKNNFIFYAPKDIVSGDFYWVDSRDGKVLFAAVDCTGHGVPGALMSVVGYNLLSQSVKEKGLTSPAKILSYLDEGVHQTLRQSQNESGIKDGMDLAICCLHPDNTLEYAGVYNSVCVVRKNIADTFTPTSSRMAFYGRDLLEIKSDKIPIGNNENDVADEFTNHKIQLQSGDCVYLYSDGFADQFGGPKGKKFKYNQLKDELIAIHPLSPAQQRERLSSSFTNWKGSLEQVDDILVIGVKI